MRGQVIYEWYSLKMNENMTLNFLMGCHAIPSNYVPVSDIDYMCRELTLPTDHSMCDISAVKNT